MAHRMLHRNGATFDVSSAFEAIVQSDAEASGNGADEPDVHVRYVSRRVPNRRRSMRRRIGKQTFHPRRGLSRLQGMLFEPLLHCPINQDVIHVGLGDETTQQRPCPG